MEPFDCAQDRLRGIREVRGRVMPGSGRVNRRTPRFDLFLLVLLSPEFYTLSDHPPRPS
jgi:hypothetical protein